MMVYQGGGADDYHAAIRLAESDDLYRWTRVGHVPLFEDFCEQVGFVGGKYDHAGTPFGDSWQLTAYSLQNK